MLIRVEIGIDAPGIDALLRVLLRAMPKPDWSTISVKMASSRWVWLPPMTKVRLSVMSRSAR
jgi:hypothetical protein